MPECERIVRSSLILDEFVLEECRRASSDARDPLTVEAGNGRMNQRSRISVWQHILTSVRGSLRGSGVHGKMCALQSPWAV